MIANYNASAPTPRVVDVGDYILGANGVSGHEMAKLLSSEDTLSLEISSCLSPRGPGSREVLALDTKEVSTHGKDHHEHVLSAFTAAVIDFN